MTMARMRGAVAILAVAVATASCSSAESSRTDEAAVSSTAPAATTDTTTLAPAAAIDLDAVIAEFVGTTPGGADVLIQRDGERTRTATGAASDSDDSLEPGQSFRVGSVSKSFIAVMVMQLVDEGLVDLDAPLSDSLPDTVVGADTTIRQLLSHQSGLANYTDQPSFFTDVLADTSRTFSPSEILTYVADAPAGPADEFAYSNTNYILLGQLIEELDAMDLNTALQQRIAGPAGLGDTFFDAGDGSVPADLVGGWSPLGGDGDPTAPYGAIASSAWAAGALISTAEDLASFLTALAAGELVSEDSLAQMTDFGTTGYGLGLFHIGFSATQTGYGHNGSIPGYNSTMAIDPATGDTLVILTNNDALVADELAFEILTS